MFQCTQIHFLEGMNLTGGIPLVEWVDCLELLAMAVGPLLVMEGGILLM